MSFFSRRNQKTNSDKELKLVNYKITFEPMGNTPVELQRKMEKLLKGAQRGSIGIIGRLQKYIKKYPEEAALKNYLYVAYKKKGKQKEAEQILAQTIKEHPDYLFGKIILAGEYIEKGEPEKVPDLLGESLEIGLLYPEKDTFHISEVQSFNHTIGQYHLARGEDSLAEDRLKMMRKIDDEDVRVADLSRRLMVHRLGGMLERTKKSQELNIQVESFPTVVYEASEISFNLENAILADFYENIPDSLFSDKIEVIKQLDRDSLIQDLEGIIEDSIKRFEWYQSYFDEFDEHQQSFLIHALYWLAALEAKDSLPLVLNMLRQGEAFLDYWFSDQLADFLHEPLYLLGESQLSVLKEFVLEPNVFYGARLCVTHVVGQVAQHQRERQEEVEQWFEEVLQFHIDHPDDNGIIDTSFITWTISHVMNINAVRLIPLVEKLWNKKWIDEMMIGDLEEIKSEIYRPHNPGDKSPIPENIEEFYSGTYLERREKRIYTEKEKKELEDMKDGSAFDILKDLLGGEDSRSSINRMDDFDDYEEYKDLEKASKITYHKGPVKNVQKIGRNESCPCGSGKKYKKCCLNK